MTHNSFNPHGIGQKFTLKSPTMILDLMLTSRDEYPKNDIQNIEKTLSMGHLTFTEGTVGDWDIAP